MRNPSFAEELVSTPDIRASQTPNIRGQPILRVPKHSLARMEELPATRRWKIRFQAEYLQPRARNMASWHCGDCRIRIIWERRLQRTRKSTSGTLEFNRLSLPTLSSQSTTRQIAVTTFRLLGPITVISSPPLYE